MLGNLFKKKRTLSGRVIKASDHIGWGNSIQWSDYSVFRIVGWLDDIPEENDEVQFAMLRTDGRKVITRYIITEVERCGNPRDMFFATVKPYAYLGEPITDTTVREAK